MADQKTELSTNLGLTREREALFASLRSEFSTPLDVIVGYAQILLDELVFYQLSIHEDDLHKILQSGQLLQNRIDEVLSFGIIDEKTNNFDLKQFSRDLQFTLLTPLNSVIGYCELLLEDEFTSAQLQFVKDVKKILRAAKSFILYIKKIDKLAKIQWKGGDLLARFKKANILIHDVITSIPPLDKTTYRPKAFKGSILVVEENAMARELLIRRVTHYGYNATPCKDASKVLEKIEKGNFDLILLSVISSGISGFEILKQIMEHSTFYYIPVIVMSPLKEIDAVVRCLEMGAADYLLKPFNPVVFKARIESSIEKKMLIDKEKLYLAQLTEAKKKTDDLLLSIVPGVIAERLKQGEQKIVERFSSVSVIFMDIVNFSKLAEKLTPGELIQLLNTLFSTMDELTDQFNLEKIKTIGDCYMAVAGIPVINPLHAELAADFACNVLEKIKILNKNTILPIQLRIGIHSGSVVAGVIGKKKFSYDLWGKTVNIASRMESHGEASRIHISKETHQLLKDLFVFEGRGTIMVKGVGQMKTYFLERRK